MIESFLDIHPIAFYRFLLEPENSTSSQIMAITTMWEPATGVQRNPVPGAWSQAPSFSGVGVCSLFS
jgi:hypothetical protein